MKIQAIYDLRTVTGFVSGSELAALFGEHCGTMSPSGESSLPKSFPLPTLAAVKVGDHFADPSNLDWTLAGVRNESAVRNAIAATKNQSLLAAATVIRATME